MRHLMLTMLVLGTGCVSGLNAQTQPPTPTPEARPPTPSASEGGRAEMQPPRPVQETADPANVKATAETTDGLAIVITIDRDKVTLDSATLARVPRNLARSERKATGDAVRASAYAGGKLVATSVAPDNVLNASEGGGLVRTERRQIAMVLAADRPVDRVDIEAPATNAKGSLDVREAYAQVCKADPRSKWCLRAR